MHGGALLYNVASAHTERDVQTDASRPDFGTTYDPVPRDFSIVFELLWTSSSLTTAAPEPLR